MACSHKNLLTNGGFEKGLETWQGKNIKITKNPVGDSKNALLMYADSKPSLLRQSLKFSPEASCAYYLYFRLLNVTPKPKLAELIADVDYVDGRGTVLGSMPLLVKPHLADKLAWSGYFAIVPPALRRTRYVVITFKLKTGRVYIDYISLASHAIDPSKPATKHVRKLH